MAVVQNTLIGSSSGQVDSIVFQSWKGRNVMRSMPYEYVDLNSGAQQAQRVRFKAATVFYSVAQIVLRPLFLRVSSRRLPLNQFIHMNIDAWDPGVTVMNEAKLSSVFLGRGDLLRFANVECKWATGYNSAVQAYVYTGADYVQGDYIVFIIIYNISQNTVFVQAVENWNGYNAFYSNEEPLSMDIVYAWIGGFSVIYGKFATPVLVKGQYIEIE